MQWPDWSGQIVAIIASGASAKEANLEPLRGRAKVIAIKENIELCPWADVVYGCDAAWWRHRNGLKDFKGLRVCWAPEIPFQFPGVRSVKIRIAKDSPREYSDKLILDGSGDIGSGSNSGFQAFNLALRWGARRIILVGFDMDDRGGVHWYGRNNWRGCSNPDVDNFLRWIRAFMLAVPDLEAIGAQVINASPRSALKAFPRRSIDDALKEWSA